MNSFIILLLSTVASLQTKIFNTPIFPFIPKLHHVVLLSNSTDKNVFNNNIINDIYIIDYTPVEDINLKMCVKLLLGEKIQGHIRIVHMNKINKATLIDDWSKNINNKNINNKNINNIIKDWDNIINNWDTTFQFYKNNCQHFGKYLINKINK